MSATDSSPEEAITKEEIEGTAPAPTADAGGVQPGTKRNAFSELMAPKPPKQPHHTSSADTALSSPRRPPPRNVSGRDGLGAYTLDPSAFPASRVIYHDADFVAINDLYPKASVHALLLPRSARRRLHPFAAFDDPAFLGAVRGAAARLRRVAAKELQRRYGGFSAQDAAREAALDGDGDGGGALPGGRDWERELLVGVHARPSMNDLHVHVLSRDMVSDCLRHRKHYLSFNTPFLIDVADFPLAADDPRRHPGRAGYMDRDLTCWRCGKNFGNRFAKLKQHLAEEFEEWKRE
ncbi:HIT domain-containing protein [Xylariomycetidae sp. FL0641]|nr:HIT domain-containing protein [Xylariomycetidae sp. FL0641]